MTKRRQKVGYNITRVVESDRNCIKAMNICSAMKREHLKEFISDNRGVVVGLNIHNAYFYTISENTTVGFAPIVTNSGVIDNVNLRNVTVTTAVRSHVAGLIANNTAQGKVANCEIVGLGLSSRRYVNYICTSNNGYIANTVRCVSASHNGNIYNGGV